MSRYEEGQRAATVTAQQARGLAISTAGNFTFVSQENTQDVPCATALSESVAARLLPGEEDMSPGWTATDGTLLQRRVGTGDTLTPSLVIAPKAGGGVGTGSSEEVVPPETLNYGKGGKMASDPKLSIYDDWEGDDDDDFLGVI